MGTFSDSTGMDGIKLLPGTWLKDPGFKKKNSFWGRCWKLEFCLVLIYFAEIWGTMCPPKQVLYSSRQCGEEKMRQPPKSMSLPSPPKKRRTNVL